jgi:hypothetical protein
MSPTDHLGLDTKSGMVNLVIKNGDWEIAKWFWAKGLELF